MAQEFTPEQKAKALDQIARESSSQEFQEQMDRADNLAKVLVAHVANDKGEILARVEENPGFQDIYDYKGGQRR